jgi:hypothetical protein
MNIIKKLSSFVYCGISLTAPSIYTADMSNETLRAFFHPYHPPTPSLGYTQNASLTRIHKDELERLYQCAHEKINLEKNRAHETIDDPQIDVIIRAYAHINDVKTFIHAMEESTFHMSAITHENVLWVKSNMLIWLLQCTHAIEHTEHGTTEISLDRDNQTKIIASPSLRKFIHDQMPKSLNMEH